MDSLETFVRAVVRCQQGLRDVGEKAHMAARFSSAGPLGRLASAPPDSPSAHPPGVPRRRNPQDSLDNPPTII